MEKYKELIEFAERVKAKGVPEQQYIAEGIFGLCADLMKAEAERDSSIGFFRDSSQVQNDSEKSRSQNDSVGNQDDRGVVPLFPKGDFPEKGYIVEDKGGTRFKVCEVAYVCKRITPEDERTYSIPGIKFTFNAAEIGTEVKVIGK